MSHKNRLVQHMGFITILLAIALSLISSAFAAPHRDNNNDSSNHIGSGQLRVRTSPSDVGRDAVLLSATADVSINAIAAGVTLTQTFANNSPDWVEGTYVFPLPENAAVDRMEMHIGDKKIVGKIRKKKQAKAIYQAAVKNGQKAALLDMSRDNLFTAKAGNIPPNSKITVMLHYVQPTQLQKNTFSLRLPTTYTPRYIVSNTHTDTHAEQPTFTPESGEEDNEIANNTLPPRSIIKNEPLATQHFSHSVSHPLSVNITLDAGYPMTTINSPSHAILSQQGADKSRATIRFANGSAPMDKDFILNWDIAPQDSPLTLTFTEQTENGYFTSLMMIPPEQPSHNSQARETIFIIDTSGSMSGVAMRQAQAGALDALNYLRPNDSFNIVEFDNSYSMLFQRSQIANAQNIAAAKQFIHQLKADGGTEMAAPLEKVLREPALSEHLKQIVFLTDGSVNNEQGLFNLIHRHLGRARLFTVGIGSAPNSFFMRQSAAFGRGTFTYIGNLNDVSEKIKALFEQLQHPALTDITVALPNDMNAKIYPNPMPDLYRGQPVVAHIKTDIAPTPDSLSISGTSNNQPWVVSLSPNIDGKSNSGLDKLWAREKINQLNTLNITSGDRNRHDAEIEKLGLAYQLVTKKTSFVAVEEKIARDPLTTPMKQKNIANKMPAGNHMAFPTTATSSTLTAILGTITLLLALIIALSAAIIARYRREFTPNGDYYA